MCDHLRYDNILSNRSLAISMFVIFIQTWCFIRKGWAPNSLPFTENGTSGPDMAWSPTLKAEILLVSDSIKIENYLAITIQNSGISQWAAVRMNLDVMIVPPHWNIGLAFLSSDPLLNIIKLWNVLKTIQNITFCIQAKHSMVSIL